MQIALSVKEVTKNFADFTAVDRVSFDVEDGKFFFYSRAVWLRKNDASQDDCRFL